MIALHQDACDGLYVRNRFNSDRWPIDETNRDGHRHLELHDL